MKNFFDGVNIIGFPRGALGLGEDARMLAKVFQSLALPVALIDAPISGPKPSDYSMESLIVDDLKYPTSIFCLPPPDMYRLALEGGRHLIDANTYNIGAWPWELPYWPSPLSGLQSFVDEVWAQSRYVESAYRELGDVAVRYMPMVVSLPNLIVSNRKKFKLCANKFIFYLMFDGNSWLSRKNPWAGIEAFKIAFTSENANVMLVIKTMNLNEESDQWRALQELSSRDSRIILINEVLSAHDRLELMKSCDVYISLHRSEGFGRVLAEAMLMEQPIIVSNFSGNVDFCDEKTSYLVDGELTPLREGDYIFSEGQYWFEPSIEEAANQFRRVYEMPEERVRIARDGQKKIKELYSIEAIQKKIMLRSQLFDSGKS